MSVEVSKHVSDGFLEHAMILDTTGMIVGILDYFISFYWIERYNKTGDFEMVMPIVEAYLPYIKINNYVSIKESEQCMIIENVTLKTDKENGDTLTISGRVAESMLDRRIVWKRTIYEGPVQSLIHTLLIDNAIHPSNSKRELPIEFLVSQDPLVTTPTESINYYGDNVYKKVSELCQAYNIGIKSVKNDKGIFVISLYAGVDRSWSQDKVPPVVFSNSYENLLESNYVQTEVEYVSNSLVRGDADDVTMEVLRKPERTKLARREMYINTNREPEEQMIQQIVIGSDGKPEIEKYEEVDDEGHVVIKKRYKTVSVPMKIYDENYYNFMLGDAKVEMSKYNVTEAFDSIVDTTRQFYYGIDYNLGDIVQVENQYGFSGRCRITEIMRSRDASGPKLIPTFVMVDENGNEVSTN